MTIDIGTTTASTTTVAADNLMIRNQMLNDNELVHRKKKIYLANCPEAYKQTKEKPSEKTHLQLRINLNFLYKIVLSLIIFTIQTCRRLKILYMQFIYFNLIVYDQIRVNLFKKNSQIEFKQIPKQVLVILNENTSNENAMKKSFSLLTDYFLKLGVETITFYKFDEIVSSVRDHLLDKYRDVNNNQQKANLKFYSYSQTGRCLFTRTCKKIALDITNNQIDLADVNKELIDDYLLESSKISEPQLVVSIGLVDSLAGFSPWHLRLSEIIKIESIKLVNNRTLNYVMFRYNKIEKRFGK